MFCCVALLCVLIFLVAAALVFRAKIKKMASEARTIEGLLPGADVAYPSIDYYSVAQALPGPDFDTGFAAFAVSACMSATNKLVGASTFLPPGFEEVGWVGGHALLLKATATDGQTPLMYVVAVAGTMTYSDLRADLRDSQAAFYGARVHRGFSHKWAGIYPAVRQLMAANPSTPFAFTGHSLGAAVATLLAASAGSDFPGTPIALYAAAPPRAGGSDFINLLASKVPNHWHIINRSDIVPSLPFPVSPVVEGADVGRIALYADYDRVVYFDFQTGTIEGNHDTATYACGLAATPLQCHNNYPLLWTKPPLAVQM